ncbi:MAG: hypothetical protein LKM32_00825 [Chiayiivirga sp.]|jgi:hypothetical protein|uniref:hypothetical protein n=1 Tax=Chiayiivirga sp. TaxID=2041042 RepID=UPI0025BD6561|nr:hypothetical protein [Chiayiivirga sp.]MCI1711220.1 hypothetical protein [Chiayiivirga sp.]MCI1727979.1 hypothetical protein [Chiayiivirga sp.]
MLDQYIPDLTLRRLPYGTHQTALDLRVFLYRGGAQARISNVLAMIAAGQLGRPVAERVPLVTKLHEVMDAAIAGGASRLTCREQMYSLRNFYSWLDESDLSVTEETARETYKLWTESLIHAVRIKKCLKATSAYSYAISVSTVMGRALGLRANALLKSTRMRSPTKSKPVQTSPAAKQNLEQTFAFGHVMASLCDALTVEAIRGPLPLSIDLPNDMKLTLACGLKKPTATIEDFANYPSVRTSALLNRAMLDSSASVEKRAPLINVRIEAELLLFCAQTSMNLGQAIALRRIKFRYQTDGDDMIAFEYKGRRGGEAVFRAFRLYKNHFLRYLAWLNDLFPDSDDGRLFPFVYVGVIPAARTLPQFKAIRTHCQTLGIRFIGTRALRKTRVNWLLRRSRDPDLTADMSGHLKETLGRDYEEPHFQSAAVEISQFHRATDPSIAPPGPGRCVDVNRAPEMVAHAPAEAPKPDCISPDGCLFCRHHRDVKSANYCWKLATHRHIKARELAGYRPPAKAPPQRHPAQAVIDCLTLKLEAMAAGSSVRAQWVLDAGDAVNAERFHPDWDGFIQLLDIAE